MVKRRVKVFGWLLVSAVMACASTGYADIATAVDEATLTWSTGGDAVWFDQSVVFANGGDAAQSGSIANSQQSTVSTVVEGPGTLTFLWGVSSEAGDRLSFSVNGGLIGDIEGTVDWTAVTQYVASAGMHTCQWAYAKDASGSASLDAGFLDLVVWTPDPDITAPANVSNVQRMGRNQRIGLSWTNPGDADFAGVRVLRKTGSTPADANDGTVVYDSTGQGFVDTGLVNGRRYYYRIFSYDSSTNYASGVGRNLRPMSKLSDYDGDGSDDYGCYDAAGIAGAVAPGSWYFRNSTAGFQTDTFGYDGTVPVSGDFDGDGTADYGLYAAATGSWFFRNSTAGFQTDTFGYAGTVPVIGDFDGDGTTDYGCYDAAGITGLAAPGSWYFRNSTAGFQTDTFGYAGTVPVAGDFDGDGKDDYGCYDAAGITGLTSPGSWYFRNSTAGFQTDTFGYDGTVPVAGDFDGDGRCDYGCYDAAGLPGLAPAGSWYFRNSTAGFQTDTFGYDGTEPVTGDFDGDGIVGYGCFDPAGVPGLASPGSWYFRTSTAGFETDTFGYDGTVAVPGGGEGEEVFRWDAEVALPDNGYIAVNLSYADDWVIEAEFDNLRASGGYERYLFNEGAFLFDLFTGPGELYLRLANGYIDFMSSSIGSVSAPGGGSDHLAITSGAGDIRSGDHTLRVEYLRSELTCRMWWDDRLVGEWYFRVRKEPPTMTNWSCQNMSGGTLRYYQGSFTSLADQE